MEISVLGIDLAKTVFQIHGNDRQGKCVVRKTLRRSQLASYIAQLPPCLIAMEACSTSNYWAGVFLKFGHEVRLIAPQFVKPFVKTNKNDSADAEAIAEAAVRPNMRFVPIKALWQQELQALHRSRQLFVGHRVATTNAIRGFLAEHGYAIPQKDIQLRKVIEEIFASKKAEFSGIFIEVLERLWQQVKSLQAQIDELEKRIETFAKTHEGCKRIQQIEGVGPLIATAAVAAMGDPKNFKNGRQFAAFLGLVPKQHSSGGKDRLLGISKRGDGYLRRLLIHGARAAVSS